MTIQVSGHYIVQSGETLQFHDEAAFNLMAPSDKKGGQLDIEGRVEVSGGAASLVGITGQAGSGETDVLIGSGGVLTVSGEGDVTGLQAHGRMNVRSSGDIEVTSSAGVAVGYFWDHSPFEIQDGFGNQGHLTVDGAVEAYGAICETRATIYAGDMDVTSGGQATGVEFRGLGSLISSGTINVSGVGAAVGCSFGDSGRATGPGALIDGELVVTATGHGASAIGIEFTSAHTAGLVTNSGTIQAQTAILDQASEGGSGLTVTNYGKIYGDVLIGAGDDKVFNTGVIRGDIHLGAGNDAYLGGADAAAGTRGSGSLNGAAYGGDGADTLVGGNHADVLYGDDGAGGAGRGADLLTGNEGDDSLYGGASADTLAGGAGADHLSGGSGADRFVFAAIADSAPAASDLITDLQKIDVVDLSGIDADTTADGDQAFTLVKALDGHAGEAALVWDKAGGQTVLQLDVDGDGAADATVLIAGKHTDFTGFVM